MGVCNVTPDSFSDGGQFLSEKDARARVDLLLAEGADILDIGGESTKPRAKPVPAREQLDRIFDVVGYAAHACLELDRPACVSVDTQNAEVARACLAAGAVAINDVSCCADRELARAVAEAEAAYVLMHSRGSMEKMAGFSIAREEAYPDVVSDVVREWKEGAARARSAGVPSDAMIMDPGLGFAKSARHSSDLVARLAELVAMVGVPVAIGASRKSFLKLADPDAEPAQRLGASVAVALVSVARGAQVLRVHDVAVTRQAIDATRIWGSQLVDHAPVSSPSLGSSREGRKSVPDA
jgi:dihydropteroate synthase